MLLRRRLRPPNEHSSVVFLQNDNGRFCFSVLPERRKIAIAPWKLVKHRRLTRYVRFCLPLPEIEALTLRNPPGGGAHISNHELNNAGRE